MNRLLPVLLCLAAALCRPAYERATGPVDRADLPVRITHVRGSVHVVEDFSYWKTNSIVYAHPGGIVFIDATWTPGNARQVIWKAALLSSADYVGLVLTSHELHHAGGAARFRQEAMPMYASKKTAALLRDKWTVMNAQMSLAFGSWRPGPPPRVDRFFEDELALLGGRVLVFFPGPAHTPDNLVVFFPEENVIYAGSLISIPDFHSPHADPTQISAVLQALKLRRPDIVIAGHGMPVSGPEILDRGHTGALPDTGR